MLEDFQTDTASMARKRHPASTARGLFGFCLAPSIHKQIRSIRLIRGKIEIQRTGAPLTRRRISLWLQGSLFVLPTAAILFSGDLEGPARQDWELRHRVLPRLVLSRVYDGRPKAERLLRPQKLFDLFPLQVNPSIRGRIRRTCPLAH